MYWKLLMSFLHMGEKINFYASHTLVYSLLNADVALSCPIQLYRTGLSGLGVGGHCPPIFGQISKPYLNQEGRLCPPQYYSPPSPDFQTFLRLWEVCIVCYVVCKNEFCAGHTKQFFLLFSILFLMISSKNYMCIYFFIHCFFQIQNSAKSNCLIKFVHD